MENLNDVVRICGRKFVRTDANVGSSWNIIGAKTRHVKAGFFCGVIAKSMQANGVCDCFCVEIIAVNNDIFRARKHKNIVDDCVKKEKNRFKAEAFSICVSA